LFSNLQACLLLFTYANERKGKLESLKAFPRQKKFESLHSVDRISKRLSCIYRYLHISAVERDLVVVESNFGAVYPVFFSEKEEKVFGLKVRGVREALGCKLN
jgi:hypothetical protein